jgi:Flp pilus assembly secretin CpaC
VCIRELCGSALILWVCGGLAAAADLGPVSLASAEEPVAVRPIENQPPVPVVSPRPISTETANAQSILRAKLAERDRLQREIDALQVETKTPEQIVVKLRMIEVNLTKMRELGLDYAAMLRSHFQGADAVPNDAGPNGGPSQTADEKFQMAIADDSIGNFLDSLEQDNFARILSEPTVVVASGRPASLHVGGEFPVPLGAGRGVEFRKYGTQLDLTAQVLGNNRLRVEARPRVSQVETNHAIKVGEVEVPGLSILEVDTAIELESGQTWVMSGLVQQRVESVTTDSGVKDHTIEIALITLITPEIVR